MATQVPIELSVVIPVYGSERILPDLVSQLRQMLEQRYGHVDEGSDHPYEVILVNDCSRDESWHVIQELCTLHPWLKGLSLRKNAGQHNAALVGLRLSSGRYVVMMDDDLQHSPFDVPRIVDQLNQGYDVCYTRFHSRKHPLWKRLGSLFNDAIATVLLKKPKGLYLSPFKGIVGGVRDEVIGFTGPHVYLDGLILSATRNITSVDLDHHARPDGKSGYSLRKSVSLWLKMATSFSVAPLRLASMLGLFFSGFGFLAAIALVVQRFTLNAMPVGWSSIIVSVLILGGIQLLALGLIGEYVGRVLLHVNGRPQAVIGASCNTGKPTND